VHSAAIKGAAFGSPRLLSAAARAARLASQPSGSAAAPAAQSSWQVSQDRCAVIVVAAQLEHWAVELNRLWSGRDGRVRKSVNLLVPLIRGAKWDKELIRTIFAVALWPRWRRVRRGARLRYVTG